MSTATSRFSPSFIELCLRTDLAPGDSMPCPKCDSRDVIYRTAKSWRVAAVWAVAAALVFWALRQSWIATALGAASILSLMVSIVQEPMYSCKHCGFLWRHRDVVRWTRGLRHDLQGPKQAS